MPQDQPYERTASYDQSIADLIRTAVRDVQDLVRSEIALAKAELREEGRRLGVGVGLIAGAAVAGVLMLAFLMSTLAWGLAAAFAWPVWIGFAVATGVLLLVAVVMALAGRRRLAAGRHLPKTTDTMKETAQWIRARTS
jgi:Flp pilus assembly protein TadB